MAALTTTELLHITRKEFGKLEKLIESVDENFAMTKDDTDISIKDIVAHRAHWITLYLGWYRDGRAGKTVYFPAEGYKWNDLTRYNSDLRTQQSDLDWSGAVAMLYASYEKLLDMIEACCEQDLYGGAMQGAKNQWTAGRWAEAAGASHFRSASKYLRAAMKTAR